MLCVDCSDGRFGGGYGRGGGGAGGYGGGGYTESKKIFVGGLAPSVTEQDFRQYFEEFGKITDAVVMIDRDTQRSRGFGFVNQRAGPARYGFLLGAGLDRAKLGQVRRGARPAIEGGNGNVR